MASDSDQRHDAITIHGLVVPVEWDDEGTATRVAIATFDEDQYFIDDDNVARLLLGVLGEEAVITGVLKETDLMKSLTQCSLSKARAIPLQTSEDDTLND